MKKMLHKKYGWFECRFSPLDAYEPQLSCKWCGKQYTKTGLPYIGDPDFSLTPTTNQKENEKTK